jgi:hypothetical protein
MQPARPPGNLSEVVAGSIKAESTANATRSHTFFHALASIGVPSIGVPAHRTDNLLAIY